MSYPLHEAQCLAYIDNVIPPHDHSPAQYEIVRQIIYATADFDYLERLQFSERILNIGAAAIASRATVIVDMPMVQVGIVPKLQVTFANPVYCATQTITRPQKQRPVPKRPGA